MFEKLLMLILSPMINREVQKIKEDPEIIAAQESVQEAIDQYLITANRQIEIHDEMDKKREEDRAKFWKTYSKK